MEYLLKVNAVIIIFYLCYKLFLERDTFFEWNRGFLLLGLVTSFIIPFIIIPNYIQQSPISIDNLNVNDQMSLNNIKESYTILDYSLIIYGLGIMFFLIRFFIQIKSLSSLINKNIAKKKNQFNFIETKNDTLPFSFFKWIVYNPEKFSKEELEQIIAHEKVHAKQYHSIDVLLAQVCCILFWFNPFIWFYIKDLKQNLEFIADENAQQKSDCKKSYQYTLLKTSMPTNQLKIVNNFYTSLIKKRIIMLQKSKSKKVNLLKYSLVIPLLVVFVLNFNTKVIAQSKDKIENVNNTGKSDASVILKLKDSKKPLIIIDGEESEKKLDELNPENIKSINVLKGESETKKYGNKGINGVIEISTKLETKLIESKHILDVEVTGYGEASDSIQEIRIGKKIEIEKDDNPLVIVDGKELPYEKLELLNEDDIESINVIKNEKALEKYGIHGKKGVIVITTK